MSSKVTRGLLFRAYPDGYLAMRGVSTVGGWTCAHAGTGTDFVQWDRPPLPWGDPGAWVLRWTGAVWLGMDAEHFHARGDLLPNLDPANDPATWACALRDLADALSDPMRAEDAKAFYRVEVTVGTKYTAGDWVFEGRDMHTFPGIDTDDPAEALCLARASLRAKE